MPRFNKPVEESVVPKTEKMVNLPKEYPNLSEAERMVNLPEKYYSNTRIADLINPNPISSPVINSPLVGSVFDNFSFNYLITATQFPTSFNATNLPVGLSINTVTGLISGSISSPGTYNITIFATNSFGTGSGTLVLTVSSTPMPVITSALTSNVYISTFYNYTITATNTPTSYNASGLPAGLTINTSTGLISGTPTVGGTYNITISATNAFGTGSATLVLQVLSISQIYLHNFGTITISGKPYTVAPVIIDANLSSSQWDTNFTGFTNFAGSTGQALGVNSGAVGRTYTLTFNVNSGYKLDITSFSFWRQRSSTAATTSSITINSISVASDTTPTVGSNTGVLSVAGLTNLTGTITLVITLTGTGSGGTYRIDDFSINGVVYT